MMRIFTVLPLAAFGASFVIPDAEVMSQLTIEPQSATSVVEELPSAGEIRDTVQDIFEGLSETLDKSKDAFDEVLETAEGTIHDVQRSCHKNFLNANAWVKSNVVEMESKLEQFEEIGKQGHRHHKLNQTVYELISKSKYTTKLAALINEYEDLVKLLNGTAANYTVFAPIDSAFEKIPEDAPKPSKEQLKEVLLYHASSEYYPAGRVLVTHTIPTLLDGKDIGGKPQRLSTNIGLKGLTVNFYSRIIAIDIVSSHRYNPKR